MPSPLENRLNTISERWRTYFTSAFLSDDHKLSVTPIENYCNNLPQYYQDNYKYLKENGGKGTVPHNTPAISFDDFNHEVESKIKSSVPNNNALMALFSFLASCIPSSIPLLDKHSAYHGCVLNNISVNKTPMWESLIISLCGGTKPSTEDLGGICWLAVEPLIPYVLILDVKKHHHLPLVKEGMPKDMVLHARRTRAFLNARNDNKGMSLASEIKKTKILSDKTKVIADTNPATIIATIFDHLHASAVFEKPHNGGYSAKDVRKIITSFHENIAPQSGSYATFLTTLLASFVDLANMDFINKDLPSSSSSLQHSDFNTLATELYQICTDSTKFSNTFSNLSDVTTTFESRVFMCVAIFTAAIENTPTSSVSDLFVPITNIPSCKQDLEIKKKSSAKNEEDENKKNKILEGDFMRTYNKMLFESDAINNKSINVSKHTPVGFYGNLAKFHELHTEHKGFDDIDGLQPSISSVTSSLKHFDKLSLPTKLGRLSVFMHHLTLSVSFDFDNFISSAIDIGENLKADDPVNTAVFKSGCDFSYSCAPIKPAAKAYDAKPLNSPKGINADNLNSCLIPDTVSWDNHLIPFHDLFKNDDILKPYADFSVVSPALRALCDASVSNTASLSNLRYSLPWIPYHGTGVRTSFNKFIDDHRTTIVDEFTALTRTSPGVSPGTAQTRTSAPAGVIQAKQARTPPLVVTNASRPVSTPVGKPVSVNSKTSSGANSRNIFDRRN